MAAASSFLERLPALHSPDYRRVFLSMFFMSASRWALMLARGWLVFELTGSSLAVGVVTFAGMSQFIVVGPVAGAVADRVDRRRLAMLALVLAMVCSAVLAALTIGGVVEVWHVVALAVAQGMATAAAQPALQALIPNLVAREHLLNAVALGGITRHGSRLVGPLFGGVLLATAGAGFVFLLSAAVMVFALERLWRLEFRPTPAHRPGQERSTVRAIPADIGAGLMYVRRDPRLVLVIGFVVFHCSFTMAFDSMMPRLATDVGGGDRTFAAILMGIGAGAIVGTLAISMVRERAIQGYTLALTGVGSGLAMLVMGVATVPAVAVAGAVLAGATQATYMAVSQTLIQQVVSDEYRARVMSIFMMLAAGHMAFVNLGFGWLADSVGVRPLLVIPGLLWVGVFLVATFMFSELRHVLTRGDFRSRPVAADVPAGGR